MARITLTPRHIAIGGGCIALVLLTGIFLVATNKPAKEPPPVAMQSTGHVAPANAPAPALTQTPAVKKRSAGKVYPKEIAYGEEVDIKEHIVPDKMMIFDFTSPYCPPCRAVAPRLENLHFDRDDVIVVKVNINRPGVRGIDFRSPVARKYKLPFVPYFVVLPADRSRVIEGREASDLVYGMLHENERQKAL